MPMLVSGWKWLEGISMVLSLFVMLCESRMSVKKKSVKKKSYMEVYYVLRESIR